MAKLMGWVGNLGLAGALLAYAGVILSVAYLASLSWSVCGDRAYGLSVVEDGWFSARELFS